MEEPIHAHGHIPSRISARDDLSITQKTMTTVCVPVFARETILCLQHRVHQSNAQTLLRTVYTHTNIVQSQKRLSITAFAQANRTAISQPVRERHTTTYLTEPPGKMICRACCKPTIRERRTEPPAPGSSPTCTSGNPAPTRTHIHTCTRASVAGDHRVRQAHTLQTGPKQLLQQKQTDQVAYRAVRRGCWQRRGTCTPWPPPDHLPGTCPTDPPSHS